MDASVGKPRVIVVGFPKSGTPTLQRALVESGLNAVHWKHEQRIVGELVYDGWFDHGDPFHFLTGVDAITQMDFCNWQTPDGPFRSLWPNLDIALLLQIRRLYSACKFILNYRDPSATAESFSRWKDLQDRVANADCPGLPSGRGRTLPELERWIDGHITALRQVFAQDPNFLEVDIASDAAPRELEAFLGFQLAWWGTENKNTEA